MADNKKPNNTQRLDALDLRLAEIEIQLGLKPPKPKSTFRQFREHVWQTFRQNWKVSVPTIALCLAVVGWFINPLYKQHLDHEKESWNRNVDDRVRSALNEANGVNQTLHEIQKTVNETKAKLDTLEPFIQDLVRRQFENAANLPPRTLGQRLPAVRHLVAVAQSQHVTVDSQIVGRLGKNLSSVESDRPEFWPTVGQFISYRSFNLNQSVLDLLAKPLPNCVDLDPGPMIVTNVPAPNKIQVSAPIYKDCQLTLDSPQDDEHLNKLIKEKYPYIVFNHALIVYRGGPINLFLKWTGEHVRMGLFTPPPDSKVTQTTDVTYNGDSLYFDQCLFDFRLQGIPSESGQRVAQGLLAQSSTLVSIPLKPATHS